MLLTHGTGFNLPSTDHIRVVFLAPVEVLSDAITRLGEFLATYRQSAQTARAQVDLAPWGNAQAGWP